MSLHERRERKDDFEALIRESLLERAGGQHPRLGLRRVILQRAARQQRRSGWRLPSLNFRLFQHDYVRFANPAALTQMLYAQALFGPRLGWSCFNSLMR